MKTFWSVVKEIVNKWIDDRVFKLSASLSFYTLISLAPLLLISISIAGSFWGESAAQGEAITQIEKLVGKESAIIIHSVLKNVNDESPTTLTTIISIMILLFASTAMFAELHDSLNLIYKLKSKPGKILKSVLKERLAAFIMVIGMGILLFASLAVGAILTSINEFLKKFISFPFDFVENANLLFLLCITFFLFCIIYKYLSDAYLAWREVLVGAYISTLLFVFGKYLISLYLSNTTYGSIYGAAGSLAMLLIWVYYSAQILFFGTECVYVLTERFNEGVKARRNAELIK